ncbi:ATP-binding protein [Persephonella sp. IF05-L8]|uniref:AAA family ATPase n=1 Tax=Persephonella sp. IF05-L8 TaxID=1158338 RepID=UPI000496DD75
MILNFTVENFRSINEPITLSFEPLGKDNYPEYFIYKTHSGLEVLKLAIIYGANATGKTNILRALDFLKKIATQPKISRDEKIEFSPFLFTDSRKNTKFEIEFIQNDLRYIYSIELNNSQIIKEKLAAYFSRKSSNIFERQTLENGTVQIKFGNKIKVNKVDKEIIEGNTLPNITTLAGILRTSIRIREIDSAIRWFGGTLKPIIEPRIDLTRWGLEQIEKKEVDKGKVIEILKNADFGIYDLIVEKEKPDEEDVKFLAMLLKNFERKDGNIDLDFIEKTIEKIELFFEHRVENKSYKLPYGEESAGTQRFYQLAIVLSLLLEKNLIFPIDEIESSLHPDLIKHFLKVFLFNTKGRPAQLILTTHYRELLQEKDLIRKDVIWFTEKKKDLSTDLYSLADFKTDKLRKEHSIYNAYKMGKLGAVPYVKTYRVEE